MTWLRIEDDFVDHPKVIGLTTNDVGVWLMCLCYTYQRGENFVPRNLPNRYAPGCGEQIAAHLVEAALWELHPHGYAFHDWDQYRAPTSFEDKQRAAGKARAAGATRAHGRFAPATHQPGGQPGGPADQPRYPIPEVIGTRVPIRSEEQVNLHSFRAREAQHIAAFLPEAFRELTSG